MARHLVGTWLYAPACNSTLIRGTQAFSPAFRLNSPSFSCLAARCRTMATAGRPKETGQSSGRFSSQLLGSSIVDGQATRTVGADRDFLLRGAGGAHILLHDQRDLKFLKQVSAAGIFGTLMSSSALAYAIAFGLGPVQCGALVLQTVSAGAILAMYLRTYVARMVLDTKRSQLLITGCGLFGEPLQQEQKLPLMAIRPGADLSEHYIKFGTRGTTFDPTTWVWYRIPRANFKDIGKQAARGAQVGFSPSETTSVLPAHLRAQQEKLQTSPKVTNVTARNFPGAGFGAGSVEDVPAAPGVPNARGRPVGTKLQHDDHNAALASAAAQRRQVLVSLRLDQGLPKDPVEEHKLVEFLKEPVAYGAFEVQQ